MSTIKLKLLKTDSEFLKTAANVILDNDGRQWYHLPFWYEEIGEGLFAEYRFNDLPESLKEFIQKERNQL
jgi:hypothetical protein